jgi:hypothetical protein
MDHISKAVEIKLHPNNLNREDGFSLSRTWKPLIDGLKKCKQALSMAKPFSLSLSPPPPPPPVASLETSYWLGPFPLIHHLWMAHSLQPSIPLTLHKSIHLPIQVSQWVASNYSATLTEVIHAFSQL